MLASILRIKPKNRTPSTSSRCDEIVVDGIGQWPVGIQGLRSLQMWALPIVDSCTTLAELIRIENKSTSQLEQAWYCAVLNPFVMFMTRTRVCWSFLHNVLQNWKIQVVLTTARNSQCTFITQQGHVNMFDEVCQILHENGSKISPNKCKWAKEVGSCSSRASNDPSWNQALKIKGGYVATY